LCLTLPYEFLSRFVSYLGFLESFKLLYYAKGSRKVSGSQISDFRFYWSALMIL